MQKLNTQAYFSRPLPLVWGQGTDCSCKLIRTPSTGSQKPNMVYFTKGAFRFQKMHTPRMTTTLPRSAPLCVLPWGWETNSFDSSTVLGQFYATGALTETYASVEPTIASPLQQGPLQQAAYITTTFSSFPQVEV